ncbi:MAG: hypothetical protein ABIJ15_07745 [bacterium]
MKEGTIAKVRSYYFGEKQFKEDLDRALKEFFNLGDIGQGTELKMKGRDEEQLNEWFIFDFRLRNGKTLLQDFYERNPLILSNEEMYIYRVLQNAEYGLWKVLKVERDKGLELENLKSGNRYFVSEKLGTHGVSRGDYFIARVANIEGRYELVGANPSIIPAGSLMNRDKKFFIKAKRLNPKIFRDYYLARKEKFTAGIKRLKPQILDNGKCVCSVCGREGKIGATRINPETDEPEILCFDCNLKLMAEHRGMTKEQALAEREKMFADFYLFKDIKLEEYLLKKKKKDFDSVEEVNKAMERITAGWNALTLKKKKSFDKLGKKELEKIFRQIKVDFSG